MEQDDLKTGMLKLVSDSPEEPLGVADRVFVDLGPLGQGATGEVRRVLDPRLLRQTALKRLRPDRVHPKLIERFTDEARIAGQLEHPNVVPVYEVGSDQEGGVYASLKLVEGSTLAERVDSLGLSRLEPNHLADLLGTLMRVCDALAYAHSRKVVHCDLKPSNILLGDFGQVYVADWGTALLLSGSDLSVWSDGATAGVRDPGGTPGFLSPEQAHGDPALVGPHTDVFGVGGLLYYVLTGVPLYGDSPPAEAVYRAVIGNWPRPDELVGDRAPRRLVAICERALARDRAQRYPDIVSLQRDLRQFLRGTWALPTHTFAPGEIVVREGDHGLDAYVVQSGQLSVYTERSGHHLELRELGPGDVFGEMAVLGDGERTASVVALTEVQALRVSSSALEEGLGLNTWLGRFVSTLAHRFHEVDNTLRDVRVSQLPAATRSSEPPSDY